ncbi:hypothetical protein ACFFX0_11870 [Citricoccus parietis]|uniref:Uncharacterized protein n=1 Tax=Citricoccus parietis TaxID=592307 RepID=A0ABV5FYV3_9MICC
MVASALGAGSRGAVRDLTGIEWHGRDLNTPHPVFTGRSPRGDRTAD